ncbi:MAG: hypothetical protein H0X43_02875 [Nitrosospira sp.]|nr:hypothetical protein [Nitrosospira sp.]
MNHSAAGMVEDSPFLHEPASPHRFSPSGTAYPYSGRPIGRAAGRPIIMLPVPVPLDSGAGLGSTYGYQYPGSYFPRAAPLHRFNGYVVCDPPNLAEEPASNATAKAPARRLVKITSTRSLAAPGYSNPCPVYTLNGEFQGQKSNTATTMPSGRNAPAQ